MQMRKINKKVKSKNDEAVDEIVIKLRYENLYEGAYAPELHGIRNFGVAPGLKVRPLNVLLNEGINVSIGDIFEVKKNEPT